MKKITPKKNENLTKEEVNGRMDDQPIHERIAERAYELYQKRGQSHGKDLDDWLEAERLVLSEHNPSEAMPALKAKPASRSKSTRKTSGEQKAAS
jgi:hypothetical protein